MRVSGRLEVKYLNEWGTVCRDNFSDNDAQVACRTMGHRGGRVLPDQQFADGKVWQNIWLDDVNCSGTEEALARCPGIRFRRVTDCDHSEDINIECKC